MIVNSLHRFIFYHVPKAAGSSIQTALRAVAGSKKPKGSKHVTPDEYLANWFHRWRAANYFSFCFVRDPYERFGSAHRYLLGQDLKRRKGCPADVNEFALLLDAHEDWVLKLHSMVPQVRYSDRVAFVGRFENLERDFSEICERLRIDATLPHVNSSGEIERYSTGFTPQTIDILSRHFQDDFVKLGYQRR